MLDWFIQQIPIHLLTKLDFHYLVIMFQHRWIFRGEVLTFHMITMMIVIMFIKIDKLKLYIKNLKENQLVSFILKFNVPPLTIFMFFFNFKTWSLTLITQ